MIGKLQNLHRLKKKLEYLNVVPQPPVPLTVGQLTGAGRPRGSGQGSSWLERAGEESGGVVLFRGPWRGMAGIRRNPLGPQLPVLSHTTSARRGQGLGGAKSGAGAAASPEPAAGLMIRTFSPGSVGLPCALEVLRAGWICARRQPGSVVR